MSQGTENDDATQPDGNAAAHPPASPAHYAGQGHAGEGDADESAGGEGGIFIPPGERGAGTVSDWSSPAVQWTPHNLEQGFETTVDQPAEPAVTRRPDPLFDPLEPEVFLPAEAPVDVAGDADAANEQVIYTEPATYASAPQGYAQDPYAVPYQEPSTDLAQQFQPTLPAEHEPQPAPQRYPQFDQPQFDQPQDGQPQDGQQYGQPHYDQQQYGGQYPQQPDPRYGQYPQQPEPQYGQYQPQPQQPGYPQAQPEQPEQRPGGQHHAQQSPSAPPAPPAAPAPARLPRPEDLLVPDQSSVTDQPASWGWRGKLNRATGGMFKAKAAEQEVDARQAISDIQHGFSRPMTVVVVQPKGGAGKTPTTICLAAAFGAHRGGYVVGWDDNETRGTLAVRVSNPDSQQATVWDLLSDLAAFERFDARVGDLSRYVRPQPDAHFDALVSDDNPGNMAQIGEDEFNRLHTVLQRFYRMIVVDTGNNVRSPNWQAAVNAADLIVVVSTYQRDVGYSGSWVLDHLAQTGREELARNAVTILSAADPTTDKTVREQLLGHFQARTRAVCEIPYDPEVAHGGPIRWTELAPETRNAWIRAGATVVNCLAQDDERSVAARPS